MYTHSVIHIYAHIYSLIHIYTNTVIKLHLCLYTCVCVFVDVCLCGYGMREKNDNFLLSEERAVTNHSTGV